MLLFTRLGLFAIERADDEDACTVNAMTKRELRQFFGILRWNEGIGDTVQIEEGGPLRYFVRANAGAVGHFVSRMVRHRGEDSPDAALEREHGAEHADVYRLAEAAVRGLRAEDE